MELRQLGKTGLAVSALGFGCGAVGGLMVRGEAAAQRRAIARAIQAGITYFDTAPSYGDGRSEENLGRTLQELGRDAAGAIVGTKFRVTDEAAAGGAAAVERAIRDSLAASLRRLGRERVHLLQLHNRIGDSGGLAPDVVLGPVADTLRRLREEGLAEHVGFTATGDPDAVKRIVQSGAVETGQVYFNALNPTAGYAGAGSGGGTDFGGVIDVAAQHGVGVIVIRPLAAGAVAASDVRHPNASAMGGGGGGVAGESYQADVQRAQRLAALAADLGLEGPVELAFRFALSKPAVSTVLVGLSDETQLEDALRWAERGPLPEDAVRLVLEG